METILYENSTINEKTYPVLMNIKNRLTELENNFLKKKFEGIQEKCEIGIALCEKLKNQAIKKMDEKTANIAYTYKMNYKLIKALSVFWGLCEMKEYEKAWSSLQDALDFTKLLIKFTNAPIKEVFLKLFDYLSIIEQLFPYKIFNSIAISECEAICSICNKSAFDPECEHIPGELYWGEMAHNVITNIRKVDHIALVEKPEDKRCVIFIEYDKEKIEESPFRYIHQFIQESEKPLSPFKMYTTYNHVDRNDYRNYPESLSCPCGSDKRFKDCCFTKESINVPHHDIVFDTHS